MTKFQKTTTNESFLRRTTIAILLALLCTGCAQDERVTKLGEQLRRMRSDVETGLNITTYSDRLRDLNFAYKEVESSEVGSEEFRKEAKLAVEAYRNAGAAWSLKLTFHDDEITFRKPRYGKKGDKLWMPPDPDFLKDQEELATLNLMIIGSGAFEGRTSGTIDELLQFYWTKAKEHSDLAVAEI